MHLESHAGLGWLLGNVAPGTDRRLRGWAVAAAVLPDVDAVAYLFGPEAYGRYHHTFGHNVFLGLAVAAAAALHHRGAGARRALVAASLVAVAFATHLLTDMKLSAYAVHLLWPVSDRGFEFVPNLGLGAPVNTFLAYASFATAALIAFLLRRTPLELVSGRLDARVVRALSPRRLACAECGAPASDSCDACGRASCARHGRIGRGFRLSCAACAVLPGPDVA